MDVECGQKSIDRHDSSGTQDHFVRGKSATDIEKEGMWTMNIFFYFVAKN